MRSIRNESASLIRTAMGKKQAIVSRPSFTAVRQVVKKLLIIVAGVLIALAVTSCSSSDGHVTDPEPNPSALDFGLNP
jgi:hypothetical protein